MYKTLAGMETDGRSEEDLNASQVSKHGELLDKAKCALFATMDSIQDKPNHVSHQWDFEVPQWKWQLCGVCPFQKLKEYSVILTAPFNGVNQKILMKKDYFQNFS